MTTSFEIVLMHLEKLGFFELIPFIISTAFFYGLLRKSKIFGEPEKNVAVNATIAVGISFMIWAYPFLTGISLHEYELMFSSFFFNSLVITLVVMFGLMIISMFAPEGLGQVFEKKLDKKFWYGILLFGIIISFLVFFGSSISKVFVGGKISSSTMDIIYSIITLIVLILIVALVVWATSKEESKSKS